jgi:hypothetical protein
MLFYISQQFSGYDLAINVKNKININGIFCCGGNISFVVRRR